MSRKRSVRRGPLAWPAGSSPPTHLPIQGPAADTKAPTRAGPLAARWGSRPGPTGVVTNPVTTFGGLLQAQWLPVVAVKVDEATLVPEAGVPRRTGGSSAGRAGNGEKALPPKRSLQRPPDR